MTAPSQTTGQLSDALVDWVVDRLERDRKGRYQLPPATATKLRQLLIRVPTFSLKPVLLSQMKLAVLLETRYGSSQAAAVLLATLRDAAGRLLDKSDVGVRANERRETVTSQTVSPIQPSHADWF